MDEQVDDPLVLVDRFKQHYIAICHHTADNPTATAPASYVMDVMFQANKAITLLARQMSLLAARQYVEATSAIDSTQGVAREPPPECEQIAPESLATHEKAVVGNAGDTADNVIGTINDYSWRDDDSDGDRDYEDDGSSDMDSEDEDYEYGDFEDIKGDFNGPSVHEQHEAESRGEQEAGLQTTLADATDEVPRHGTENRALCTIFEADWADENSAEDQDFEDNGSSDDDSEDDYYEYGDFDDDEKDEDEEEQDAAVSTERVQPEGAISQVAESPVEHAVLGNINDNVWDDEDSEGDQDWEDDGSSERDSEDDYYEYGDFEDDDDRPVDGVQHVNGNGDEQQSGIANELTADFVAVGGHAHCTCTDTTYWRDVYDRIPGLVAKEDKTLSLTIHWDFDPPYRDWRARGLSYVDVGMQISHALDKMIDTPPAQKLSWTFDIISETGDINIRFETATDRTQAIDRISTWFPFLERSEVARIPGVYNPLCRAKSNVKLSRKSRSPQVESRKEGMGGSVSALEDSATGWRTWGISAEASPSSQTRSEGRLERRRTKRRQKRLENKLKKDLEVMAC